jgi:hypothetical protein
MKILREAFFYLHFRFELFLAQEYWHKCAHKMLVKLTTGRRKEPSPAGSSREITEDQPHCWRIISCKLLHSNAFAEFMETLLFCYGFLYHERNFTLAHGHCKFWHNSIYCGTILRIFQAFV